MKNFDSVFDSCVLSAKLHLYAIFFVLIPSILSAASDNQRFEVYIKTEIANWVETWDFRDELVAQNGHSIALSQNDIDALETLWSEQILNGGDFINSILNRETSLFLKDIVKRSGGLFREIFIHDASGINFAQSSITSDYWQGDEEKSFIPGETLKTYVSEPEFDESVQGYLVQVNVPITMEGNFIGVITVGVDLDIFESLE